MSLDGIGDQRQTDETCQIRKDGRYHAKRGIDKAAVKTAQHRDGKDQQHACIDSVHNSLQILFHRCRIELSAALQKEHGVGQLIGVFNRVFQYGCFRKGTGKVIRIHLIP